MSFWIQYKQYISEKNSIAVTLDHLSLIGFFTSLIGLIFALSATDDVKIIVCIAALALTIICLIWLNVVNAVRSWQVARNLFDSTTEIKETNDKLIKAEAFIKRTGIINENVSARLHDFAHLLKDTLISFCMNEKGTDRPDYIFKNFLISGLDHIKSIFDSLTGDQCSVCIKTIDLYNDEFIAETLERDNSSRVAREIVDRSLPKYNIKNSTPFLRITSKDYPDRYFACDDLSVRDREYSMPYTNFPDFYNATIVTPIRRNLKDENNKPTLEFDTFGFLCIDNFQGGFQNETAKNLLSALADILYCLFYLYKTYPERIEKDETIGVVYSKDRDSVGYPRIENEKSHSEYLRRVYKVFNKEKPL